MRYPFNYILFACLFLISCGQGEEESKADEGLEVPAISADKDSYVQQNKALLNLIFDAYAGNEEINKHYYDRAMLIGFYVHDIDPEVPYYELISSQLKNTPLMKDDRSIYELSALDEQQVIFDKYAITRGKIVELSNLNTDLGTPVMPYEEESREAWLVRIQLEIRLLEYNIYAGMLRQIEE